MRAISKVFFQLFFSLSDRQGSLLLLLIESRIRPRSFSQIAQRALQEKISSRLVSSSRSSSLQRSTSSLPDRGIVYRTSDPGRICPTPSLKKTDAPKQQYSSGCDKARTRFFPFLSLSFPPMLKLSMHTIKNTTLPSLLILVVLPIPLWSLDRR